MIAIGHNVVPVQLYLFFLQEKVNECSVSQICDLFDQEYNMNLKYDTVQKICKEMVAAGIMVCEQKPAGKKNKLTAFYSIKK